MSANSDGSGKDRKLNKEKKALEAAQQKATQEVNPAAPPRNDDRPAESQPDSSPPQPAGNEPTRDQAAAGSDTESQPAVGSRGDYRDAYRNSQEQVRKLQSKYDTLQGKYKAEVGRLQKENRELQEQLNNRGSSNGSAQPPSNSTLEAARSSEQYKRIAKEWDEETAEDFAGMMAAAIAAAAPQSAPQHPAPTDSDVDIGPTDHGEFMDALDLAVPGWDLKYNSNDAFNRWAANAVEPLSGKTYLEVLRHAAEVTHDVDVAKRVFSAFDRAQAGENNVDTYPDFYTEPSGAGGDGPPQPPAPTFREGDLQAMEQKYRRGKVTREELMEFQKEYMKANREGRLQVAQ